MILKAVVPPKVKSIAQYTFNGTFPRQADSILSVLILGNVTMQVLLRGAVCVRTVRSGLTVGFQDFKKSARTVVGERSCVASASSATVRNPAVGEPFPRLNFLSGADAADGVDGCAPA